MIASKYVEVESEGGVRMICRLCGTEVYSTPPQSWLDLDRMDAVLEHFHLQHQVSRQELARDLQDAFQKGMRREEKRYAKYDLEHRRRVDY